jgi:hypothetical protein
VVVQPYARRVQRDLQRRGTPASDYIHVLGITNNQLASCAEPGKRKTVKLAVVDAITMWLDTNIEEVYDAVDEWVEETGSTWPKGFEPTKRHNQHR